MFRLDKRAYRNTLASLPGSNLGRAVHTAPAYRREAYLRRKSARRAYDGDASLTTARSVETRASTDIAPEIRRRSRANISKPRRSAFRSTNQALLEEIREMK